MQPASGLGRPLQYFTAHSLAALWFAAVIKNTVGLPSMRCKGRGNAGCSVNLIYTQQKRPDPGNESSIRSTFSKRSSCMGPWYVGTGVRACVRACSESKVVEAVAHGSKPCCTCVWICAWSGPAPMLVLQGMLVGGPRSSTKSRGD